MTVHAYPNIPGYWLLHVGKECPVAPDVMVHLVMQGNTGEMRRSSAARVAGQVQWDNDQRRDLKIIAYSLAGPPKESEPAKPLLATEPSKADVTSDEPTHPFKVRDFVLCTHANHDLVKGEIYRVAEVDTSTIRLRCLDGFRDASRFRLATIDEVCKRYPNRDAPFNQQERENEMAGKTRAEYVAELKRQAAELQEKIRQEERAALREPTPRPWRNDSFAVYGADGQMICHTGGQGRVSEVALANAELIASACTRLAELEPIVETIRNAIQEYNNSLTPILIYGISIGDDPMVAFNKIRIAMGMLPGQEHLRQGLQDDSAPTQ